MSKIESIINEIEMYLDSCKPQAFSNNKRIVVEKDVIDEMLVELRMETPEEIKKYQKIIANKDAILADAKAKADTIIDDANKQTEIIISEHSITTQAQARAQEIIAQAEAQAKQIVDEATAQSNAFKDSVVSYTFDELSMIENLLQSTLSKTEARYNGFAKQLSDALDVVTSNKQQLTSSQEESGGDTSGEDGIDVVI